jgi:aspartyl-tRNA(Asn)/glutamyl-tRNA(Gln) amidotransferase subunit B
MKNKYIPVIGLEVHVELKTKSKMFCGCSNDYFGQKPNTHTCPVCLGLPGALPVPNKKAIEWCVMIGMALDCNIPLISKFDRKNYFYPDLAKGYQISQYDQPFAVNGKMRLANGKTITIRRAHMEEDTGKLLHEVVSSEDVSLIDFNRSGVPLVEIVTDPDFENAKEVTEYLQKLKQIVKYVGVSSADMEKGEMRLEPNISLRLQGEKTLPAYKVEVKNINSFHFVEDAITFEIRRQTEMLEKGDVPKQETRGWNEDKKKTISQRSKEEAHDYRYFPEPDIPPIQWTKVKIQEIRKQMPELPVEKIERFKRQYDLSDYNTEILTRERQTADFFEEAVPVGKTHKISPKDIANWLINRKSELENMLPATLIKHIIASRKITGIGQNELQIILKRIIKQNKKAAEEYKKGKGNAIMFLVGQAMKELKGKERPDTIKEELQKLLQ